jgi:hypothetical protein
MPGLTWNLLSSSVSRLVLKSDTAALAREIYGSLAPETSFHGQVGDGKEPLFVYVMNLIRGISQLDFILAHGFPENSEDNFLWRKNLMSDLARYGCPSLVPYTPNGTTTMPLFSYGRVLIYCRFFALSWKAPQEVDPAYREVLRRTYTTDLQLLLHYLPLRFHQIIQQCLDSMDAVLSLPMVLLHRDFNSCNIMVDSSSCHLTGVIDWAEAEICPFGQNLYALEVFTGTLHLKNGWRRYDDYEVLRDTFWSTFQHEAGGISSDTVKTIRISRIMGLLRSSGFTIRLANAPPATPISDDEKRRYNMLSLDGFLIHPATRFDELGEEPPSST